MFDPDGLGVIPIADMRYLLSCLGDKMDNDEVDDILKEVDSDGSGLFKYEAYVREKLKDKIKK